MRRSSSIVHSKLMTPSATGTRKTSVLPENVPVTPSLTECWSRYHPETFSPSRIKVMNIG